MSTFREPYMAAAGAWRFRAQAQSGDGGTRTGGAAEGLAAAAGEEGKELGGRWWSSGEKSGTRGAGWGAAGREAGVIAIARLAEAPLSVLDMGWRAATIRPSPLRQRMCVSALRRPPAAQSSPRPKPPCMFSWTMTLPTCAYLFPAASRKFYPFAGTPQHA